MPSQKPPIDANNQASDQPPADILRLRRSIDNVDAALVFLLAERFALTGQVGEIKARYGLPPADEARDDWQITRIKQLAAVAGLDPEFAEAFREFVVTEVIRRHRLAAAKYAESGQDVPELDTYA